MANDNLLMGITGLLEGVSRGFLPFAKAKYEAELGEQARERESQREFEMYKQKLPLETEAKLKVARETPYTFISPTGEQIYTGAGKVSVITPKDGIEGKKVDKLSGLTQIQQNAAFKLADDYEKISSDFNKVVAFYNRVSESVKEPSAAGDLSLIFNYMKMLDPSSVVREGEFATAQNSGSIPDVIQARYNKVLRGERLSNDIRSDFHKRSQMLYSTALKQQRMVDKQFSDRSEKFGIPSDLVIRETKSHEYENVQPSVSQTILGERYLSEQMPTQEIGAVRSGRTRSGLSYTVER